MPAISPSMSSAYRSKRWRTDSQNLRMTNLPELNGRQALVTRRYSQTASRTFNAAPPIDTTAATTGFSSVRLRLIPITGRSRCCSLAAVTADFSPLTMFQHRVSHEKTGLFRSVGLFCINGIYQGHDLFSHQNHGLTPKLAILPVL